MPPWSPVESAAAPTQNDPGAVFWGLSSTGWAAVAAIATAVTALTAVLAVLAAWRQVRHAVTQLEESRKAQAEADRPYVIVAVEPSTATRLVMELVIRNSGRRPAVAVRITVDPPPIRTGEKEEGHPLAEAKILSEPIGMLAPGQELRVTFDFMPNRLKTDLPNLYTAQITYRDTSGHEYAETALLDLYVEEGTSHIVTYGIHDAATALREIRKTLEKSSVLARKGQVSTDTAVEARVERDAREPRSRQERLDTFREVQRRTGREHD